MSRIQCNRCQKMHINKQLNMDHVSISRSSTPTLSNSDLSKGRSGSDLKLNEHNQQQQNVADLLDILGIKDESCLHEIIQCFKPITVGHGVKINELINLQENIIVVQSGEVILSFKDGGSFQMSKSIKNGGVIYSKLAVIQYLLNTPGPSEYVLSLIHI